jgi:cytoskeletal protein CcmA (bactofilin family)
MFGNKNTSDSINHSLTLIGESATIDGNLSTKASIKVDGRINGDVHVEGRVIVSESGQIQGNVNASEIEIYGKLDGNVTAKTLSLRSGGHITGNISVKDLEIESGASYQGHIQMQASVTTTV